MLNNFEKKYEEIKKVSPVAFDFLDKLLGEDIENGTHNLSDGVFVNVMTYETKHRWETCFEAHKKYIDIQIIIKGSEIISVQPAETMHKYECIQSFGDGDAELYVTNNECVDYVLGEGDFIILRPEDAHMPCVCIAEPATVKKAVFKVPV